MKIAEILKKMITFSNGNIHDIDHLIKVWTYAKTIGELEGLDPETQFVLEVAAITHDIACPLCREKYGNANGKYQEIEGAPLVTEFLSDTGMTTEQISHVFPQLLLRDLDLGCNLVHLPVDFLPGQLFDLHAKRDIVIYSHCREKCIALEHHANISFLDREIGNVFVSHINLTL